MHERITPRARIERGLRSEYSDRIPFTIYENKVPQCRAERLMRNRGMCIVQRRSVFGTRRPNVKTYSENVYDNGRRLVRTYYETPVGSVSTLTEPAGFTTWWHERMFKSPEDYKILLFMINDEIYKETYASFAEAEATFGEDAIFRAAIGLEPLQELISGPYLGTEAFCMEWMDRRDEILTLYEALVNKRRQVYPLVAASPASHANYGGNVVPEIIGDEVFRRYYLPHYNEAAEILHKHGKLIGCHFDANCRLLAASIAESALDYVEAFTPAPNSDMTLTEARVAWPDKVLWLNFPSSLHLRSDEEVRKATVELLEPLSDVRGIIMGITEDMPPERWQRSCTAIMDGLDEHATQRPELYRPL